MAYQKVKFKQRPGRNPRNQLDVVYVLNEIEKGRTQKDIADEFGVSQGHVREEIARYKEFVKRCETIDRGKIFALRRARWSIKDIACDMLLTENVVAGVLKGEM